MSAGAAMLGQVAADIGARGVSALLGRLIAGKRKELDLTTPAINEAQASLTDLEDQQRRQQALMEMDLARTGSAGFSGAAARQDLLMANAKAGATMRAGILDTLANARQQQELINTEAKNAERMAIIQGMTQAGAAVGSGASSLIGQNQLLNTANAEGAATLAPAATGPVPVVANVQSTPSQPAPTLNDLKSQYSANSVPTLSNVVDYRTMNQRMFQALQIPSVQ
jgi:hypothetical protein